MSHMRSTMSFRLTVAVMVLTAACWIRVSEAQQQQQLVHTQYGCEGESLALLCRPGTSISVVRANFGRFSVSVCNPQGRTNISTHCSSSPSTSLRIHTMCSGMSRCTIDVSKDTFEDNCPETPKYMEVQHQCLPEEQHDRRQRSRHKPSAGTTMADTERRPLPPPAPPHSVEPPYFRDEKISRVWDPETRPRTNGLLSEADRLLLLSTAAEKSSPAPERRDTIVDQKYNSTAITIAQNDDCKDGCEADEPSSDKSKTVKDLNKLIESRSDEVLLNNDNPEVNANRVNNRRDHAAVDAGNGTHVGDDDGLTEDIETIGEQKSGSEDEPFMEEDIYNDGEGEKDELTDRKVMIIVTVSATSVLCVLIAVCMTSQKVKRRISAMTKNCRKSSDSRNSQSTPVPSTITSKYVHEDDLHCYQRPVPVSVNNIAGVQPVGHSSPRLYAVTSSNSSTSNPVYMTTPNGMVLAQNMTVAVLNDNQPIANEVASTMHQMSSLYQIPSSSKQVPYQMSLSHYPYGVHPPGSSGASEQMLPQGSSISGGGSGRASVSSIYQPFVSRHPPIAKMNMVSGSADFPVGQHQEDVGGYTTHPYNNNSFTESDRERNFSTQHEFGHVMVNQPLSATCTPTHLRVGSEVHSPEPAVRYLPSAESIDILEAASYRSMSPAINRATVISDPEGQFVCSAGQRLDNNDPRHNQVRSSSSIGIETTRLNGDPQIPHQPRSASVIGPWSGSSQGLLASTSSGVHNSVYSVAATSGEFSPPPLRGDASAAGSSYINQSPARPYPLNEIPGKMVHGSGRSSDVLTDASHINNQHSVLISRIL